MSIASDTAKRVIAPTEIMTRAGSTTSLHGPHQESLPADAPISESTTLMEALYRVLVHNDDVTPFDYVTSILHKIFLLSTELAEHVAITAHNEGVAVVIIRPRTEAERLSGAANRSARADGYPLTFSLEPDL